MFSRHLVVGNADPDFAPRRSLTCSSNVYPVCLGVGIVKSSRACEIPKGRSERRAVIPRSIRLCFLFSREDLKTSVLQNPPPPFVPSSHLKSSVCSFKATTPSLLSPHPQ